MAAVLCGIVFVVVTVVRARALTGLLLVCLGAAGSFYLSFQLFKSQGVFISPLPAILVLLANFAILNVMQFRREELRNMRQTHALALAQAAIIESMASLTETRDPETGGHIKRTQLYVRLLALAMREAPAYRERLNDETIELLGRSAPLHDIGKVGVSDSILLKRGPLTREEFEEMKKHTTIGKEVIESIDHSLGNDSFLQIALEIAYTHHEKWNGAGYPQGLKGEQIPLSGRLMAIADVYDALTSKRVYREALSHEKALEIMHKEAEASFDPQIFAKFLEISDAFKKIALSGIFDPPERQEDRGSEKAQGVVSAPTLNAR
jgi:response regulator RpfG family c-di-GMP phosphodiesterase